MSEAAEKLTAPVIILQQLGRMTLAMLGAHAFVITGSSLTFKIRGTQGKVTHIRITLTPDDTYTVTFQRVRAGVVNEVATDEGVYSDGLHHVIASRTGLRTAI